MHFNFNSTEPIYLQVASQIEEAIFTKNYAEKEQIPSTTEISRDFHINPATVLKGINLLVSSDLVEKKAWNWNVCCSRCIRKARKKNDENCFTKIRLCKLLMRQKGYRYQKKNY